jgi:integrase
VSIDKRPNGSYRARWREIPGGPQKTQTFDRKIDAERHLLKVNHDLLVGTYVDPRQAQTPLSVWAERWLERMRPTWRPMTSATNESGVRLHIVPKHGKMPLGAIRRTDVEAWAAALDLAPSTVATVRKHLNQMLKAAVEDGLIARNPAVGARMPRNESARPAPVPHDVIEAITAALPSWARVAVPLGLGAGLRQSEATGLTVDRVQFLRRTIRIDRQLVTNNSASPELGPTKTAKSNRSIPLAVFVADRLSAHIAEHGTGDHGLILHQPDGRPIGRNRFGRLWRAARTVAEAEYVDYHDLRQRSPRRCSQRA